MTTTAEAPHPASYARRVTSRVSLSRLLLIVTGLPALVVVAAVVVGILTIGHQNTVRNDLLLKVEPANAQSLRLLTALVNEETGIRGYELTGERSFLAPYTLGDRQARSELAGLARNISDPEMKVSLARVLHSIRVWQSETAEPAIRAGASDLNNTRTRVDTSLAGKAQFDAIRNNLARLQSLISARVRETKTQLQHASTTTTVAFSFVGAALLLSIALAAVFMRRFVTRPVGRLGAAVRRVTEGDLQESVATSGPRDIELLSDDVEAMRLRLAGELSASQSLSDQLSELATDLQRSNAELEQFAYVASHDLQEPLRKVTSFCQLLEKRYGDQLDDRGHQYIGFAVDGAMRMQQLVNDLLAFSRVGRSDSAAETVALNTLVTGALADLSAAITKNDAEIEVGPLPELAVKPALIRAVFQNLIANAIKFRADAAPHVTIVAERDGENWRICCTDNGIGIESQYAERIFIIFQRLHTREAYPGTGIGLAMCRKIIEHHGGRMWLDTDYSAGSRLCFTLPAEDPTVTSRSQ